MRHPAGVPDSAWRLVLDRPRVGLMPGALAEVRERMDAYLLAAGISIL